MSGLLDSIRAVIVPHCVLCGATTSAAALCEGCLDDLPGTRTPRCPLCPIETSTGETCGACLPHRPPFSSTLAACSYGYPVDQLIAKMKYGSDITLAEPLAHLLIRALRDAPSPDLVVPVPLSPQRLRQRGFNQALELCRPLARARGIRLRTEVLTRQRDNPAQAALPLAQRVANVHAAFHCSDAVKGMSVAIVDDVMTSGATLCEVARSLVAAGAREVRCWVLARTPRP